MKNVIIGIQFLSILVMGLVINHYRLQSKWNYEQLYSVSEKFRTCATKKEYNLQYNARDKGQTYVVNMSTFHGEDALEKCQYGQKLLAEKRIISWCHSSEFVPEAPFAVRTK